MEESKGLGLLCALTSSAWTGRPAKAALGSFLSAGNFRPNQIQFLDEIVNHLTEHGCMDAARLYESPYTDFSPKGVEGVFTSKQVDAVALGFGRGAESSDGVGGGSANRICWRAWHAKLQVRQTEVSTSDLACMQTADPPCVADIIRRAAESLDLFPCLS